MCEYSFPLTMNDEKFHIKTLHTLDTQQPADCLEWCTHPDFPHHFICGTYHLEEGETDFSQPPTSMMNLKFSTQTAQLTNKSLALHSF